MNTAPDSLDAVFRPRSVAVVGASRRRFQIGHEIVRNLVAGGFTGPVYPVNPGADVVNSMHCHPRVSDIPGPVDLAVIVVPGERVFDAVRDCARKGVRGVVVISAGFAEVGGKGVERQAELLALCRKHGMRLVGPNCMGVLNTEEAVAMNASFANSAPVAGGASFLSQSGALGEAILSDARALGIGIRQFASVGNRADVSPPDLLEYWDADPGTEQILMYLESFGDPVRFMKTARRVSRNKPVMVVKAGRSARGAQAAISHTGSLAGSAVAADTLLHQCGVLRVDTMKDLFALAGAVQAGRFPEGNGVAIVTNAGGPAILATDACEAQGLELVDLAPNTLEKLLKHAPPEASVTNPVDLIASADAERFDHALRAVLADRRVDMVLAIFVSPVMIDTEAVARVFAKHAARSKKPVVTCMLGKSQGELAVEVLRTAGVPNYRFPEEAVHALGGLWHLQQLRSRPQEPIKRFPSRKKVARAAVAQALAAGRETLKGVELEAMMKAYGIPVVPSRIVMSRDEALAVAPKLGWPLVAKVVARDVVHKSDLGGVVLGIQNEDDLLAAYDTLEERFLGAHPEMHVLLQAMRSDGVELFFGAATDPQFGRMIAFGLGGIHVEVFKDVVFRLHPLRRNHAEEMVDGIRAKALLEGARGKPPVDREELIEVLLRLSQMLTDVPEIAELDLNPFLAGWRGEGSCVLDMRVRLQQLED